MKRCCIDAEFDSRYWMEQFEKRLAIVADETLRESAPAVFREVLFDYLSYQEHRARERRPLRRLLARLGRRAS